MIRLIVLTLLLSLVITPAFIGTAYPAGPEDAIKAGHEGFSSYLRPAAKFMSGASALAIEGKDYRLGVTKEEALRSVGGSRSPIMQSGAAAAALVPFRSASPSFSRNLLITRDLGGVPIQTEPHIAVDPLDPEHLVVGVIDYNAPGVVSYVSIDGGASWDGPFQQRYIESDLGSGGDPVVAFDRNGRVYMASISIGFEAFKIRGNPLEEIVSSIAISASDDGGYIWGKTVSSARSKVVLNISAADQTGVIGTIALGFLDKPWMSIGPDTNDPSKDAIYLSYTHFVQRYSVISVLGGGIIAFQNPVVDTTIELVKSVDGGKTWSSPVKVSPTVTQVLGANRESEQFADTSRVVQGSQPAVTPDGAVYVGWIDSTDDEAFRGIAQIWVAKSTDGGRTFSKPTKASEFLEPDFSSRTAFFRSWGGAFPKVAAGGNGNVSIIYIAKPPSKPTDDGDVYYIRSNDGGKTWSQQVRVNDDETVAYQTMPAVSVDPNGAVHAMWGDFRDDKSEKRFNIYHSKSEDGGKTWSENIRVTDFPTNANLAFPQGQFIGDYFGITSTKNDVYMVWADGRLGEFGGANQKIAFARLSPIKSSSIFLSPPSGPGGEDIVIQGFDFQPEQDIFIEVSGAVVSSSRTDVTGKFSTQMFVPISGEGAHNVRVFDASGNVATASFYMAFGFDTIQKSLRAINSTKTTVPGTPISGNNTETQGILESIRSSQQSIENRMNALEQNINVQANASTTQTWITTAVAIAAIAIAALALFTRRRGL